MRQSLLCSVGDQQHVASVMRRWRKGLVHLEYPRLCFLRVLPAGVLGNFGGDLCARCLLRIRRSHCGIRILGPLPLSERQAEHVGRVPSYCGRTSALRRRLSGKTSIRRSLVGEKFAALTSGRGDGGGRGGPLTSVKKGAAPPTQKLIVICRARAGLSKNGQESHRTCARSRHSGHDFRVDTRNRVLA
ncbi:putative thimet oligopeptidase, putative,metallo-peptidase, clan MA(E), family M3, partial [Trypanosoma cruzi]